MTLGSLFSGSGGFELAGLLNGIEPRWNAEIEPFPCAVTAKRFPGIPNHGDVTKINGSEIEPVDIITFGSPCQDLSVAGLRKGIHEGQRSNLFFEAIRIIKEMREATNGKYPRFAVWENVPGAFSSNGGSDFRAVLEALCQVKDPGISVPGSDGNPWKHAGCIVGAGYSIAWRVYDAQFWGVPQRRARIYLIADFGSERAGEILFESKSMPGDPAESGEPREAVTADSEGSTGRSDRVKCLNPFDVQSKHIVSPDGAAEALCAGEKRWGSLPPNICYSIDGYNASQSDKASTLGVNCGMSTGRNGVCYSLEGNGARPSHQGCGYSDDGKSFTLNTIEKHGVCYSVENHPNDSRVTIDEHGKVQTLSSRMGTGGNNTPLVLCVRNGQSNQAIGDKAGTLNCMHDQQAVLCVSTQQGGATIMDDKCPTLTAAAGMSGNNQPYICQDGQTRKYIVRRLTPTECGRLQGFPDGWTDDVEGSDSARYKLWGNGIALPCAVDVLGRIAKELKRGISNEETRTAAEIHPLAGDHTG